jgi:hypothetical protein
MSLIIQAATIGGITLDQARWEVDNITNVREGHPIQISLNTKDPQLIKYISKQDKSDCVVEKEKSGYSVILRCAVKEIRHLVDADAKKLETRVLIIPVNRYVEGVIVYMLHPSKCDPRFIQAIRGTAPPASTTT